MRNTSSCQLYLLHYPPTTPHTQTLTKTTTMTMHHHQCLHLLHHHHIHHLHLHTSNLQLLPLAPHHLHLIHHTLRHHHHNNIINLQLPHHNQFGVNSTYKAPNHTTTCHHHTPHHLHLILRHRLHLHRLLWWAHHLDLRATHLTYFTHRSHAHQNRRAVPLHLRTTLPLLLHHLPLQQHLLIHTFLLLLPQQQNRLSQPCQPDRSRDCSAGHSSAWPE